MQTGMCRCERTVHCLFLHLLAIFREFWFPCFSGPFLSVLWFVTAVGTLMIPGLPGLDRGFAWIFGDFWFLCALEN